MKSQHIEIYGNYYMKGEKNPRHMIPKIKSKAQEDQVWVGTLGFQGPSEGPGARNHGFLSG